MREKYKKPAAQSGGQKAEAGGGSAAKPLSPAPGACYTEDGENGMRNRKLA